MAASIMECVQLGGTLMINFYLYIVMGSTGILLPNYALLSVVLINPHHPLAFHFLSFCLYNFSVTGAFFLAMGLMAGFHSPARRGNPWLLQTVIQPPLGNLARVARSMVSANQR